MRKASRKEQQAYERAVTRAVKQGLAFRHPLDQILRFTSLWLEPEPLRAKMLEHVVAGPGTRFGLAFVPAGRYFDENSYHIAPLHQGHEQIPTLVVPLPAATIETALRDPDPLAALLDIEAKRVRAQWEQQGLPVPPAVMAFFEDEEEA
jgi:hypothetical protein